MTAQRLFARSFDSLQEVFAFSAAFFARHELDPRLLPAVDLTLEELFTNMVKYSPGGEASVRVEMTALAGGVEVQLTDYDVDRFDVTQAPDADVELPIEARRPGGLGLHLIRRFVDSLQYEYSNEARQSRITFRTTVGGQRTCDRELKKGEADAAD
jgi:anti-sigma regulatory factor (Ser/Thr protein kinase)